MIDSSESVRCVSRGSYSVLAAFNLASHSRTAVRSFAKLLTGYAQQSGKIHNATDKSKGMGISKLKRVSACEIIDTNVGRSR